MRTQTSWWIPSFLAWFIFSFFHFFFHSWRTAVVLALKNFPDIYLCCGHMKGHPYDLPLQGVCVDCSLSEQECVSEAAVTWDERGSYWLTPLPTSCGRNWKVLWRHKRLEALWASDWKVGFSLTTEPFSWSGVFYDHSFCKTRLQYRKKDWLQRSQVA